MKTELFHPTVATWFERTYGLATPVQAQAWPVIKQGKHTLIAAPTGSGKTLAAFLCAIDDLVRAGLEKGMSSGLLDETYVLYISPLKALSNDIHKNLEEPLSGITRILAGVDKEGLNRLDAGVRQHDVESNSKAPTTRHTGARDPQDVGNVARGQDVRSDQYPVEQLEKGSDPLSDYSLRHTGERQYPVEQILPAGQTIEIRSAVRTGDTTQTERNNMRKKPPHILVTTPESLYILLTSDSGREMLKTVRTVIVDEIHALAGNKRGAHLALSLERLDALTEQPPVRIGLSATQKPIEDIARFLVGNRDEPCEIVDTGYTRKRDLAIVVPDQPLGPLMAEEGWADIYNRLAAIAEENTTTLIFVNTRRLAERAARHLADRLGEENVTAHHGSLAKEHRLDAEQRLKQGKLKVLVATASLELGIDIGDVSCVCQIGTPRSIAAFLQRVGRSGHQVNGVPKGRLFPLTRDDLLECVALLDAIQRGELDRIHIPLGHIDVLCQQIIGEVASREWDEDALYTQITKAWPYRALTREHYNECLAMLAEGYTTRRGRRSRYIFHDTVNKRLKPRDGARLTAVTNAGAIPDQFDYNVILEPQGLFIGTLNEDFAFESMPGDIFQLGNTAYRILKVETGKVRVEDAHGQPPTMPFWFGEAPGRSDELSAAVSRLRENIDAKLKDGIEATTSWLINQLNGKESSSQPVDQLNVIDSSYWRTPVSSQNNTARSATAVPAQTPEQGLPSGQLINRLDAGVRQHDDGSSGNIYASRHTGERDPQDVGNVARGQDVRSDQYPVESNPARSATGSIESHVAQQLVDYLAATKAALGHIPTQDNIYFERFFDEAGDQHLVIHSPYGSRINRAWGLALRKRFCRQFNFELQAAALEDSIVISLGATHSFPLVEVTEYLRANSVRDILIQALLAAPVFMTRWRWVATISLALKRNMGGKRIPPQFQRMDAEDLIAVVFPDQLACQENITGDREVPEHPLVQQTIEDCLHEVMDIDGLVRLLTRLEQNEITIHCRDLNGPSPLAQEILFARPYAFLDDAPAEERRTQAVNARRFMDPSDAADLAGLDPEAIKKVAEEAWPDMDTVDKLHDALMVLGFVVGRHSRESGNPVEQCPPSGRSTNLLDAGLRQHDEVCEPSYWRTPVSSNLINTLITERRATTLQTKHKTLWVCAERLPLVKAVFETAILDPHINASGPATSKDWTKEEALIDLLRARLEGSGIVKESDLQHLFECTPVQIRTALMALENEGYAMRGNFTGSTDTEWCERGLLARIHRYTIKSLRNEIAAVTAADYMRFLFAWHGMTERPEGEDSLLAALDKLEGYAIPAAAWETDVLPGRIKGYQTNALDTLCVTGRIVWTRFASARSKPKEDSTRSSKAGLLRNTPILLLDRHNVDYWRPHTGQTAHEVKLSANATTVLTALKQYGALFFIDIVKQSGLLRTHAEEALAELAACGLVTSDSYAGLRALIAPANKKPGYSRHRRRAIAAPRSIDDAGRWSIIAREKGSDPLSGSDPVSHGWIQTDPDTLNHIAWTLLKRYGVVFHKMLERESGLPPWRELLYAWRRMEARGEIRGGRFVEGFSGEQFALPDAVALLRKYRDGKQELPAIVISATDPLNLVGILLPGERISALHTNRILFKNGLPAAKQLNGEIEYFGVISPHSQWEINFLLTRKKSPASVVQEVTRYSN